MSVWQALLVLAVLAVMWGFTALAYRLAKWCPGLFTAPRPLVYLFRAIILVVAVVVVVSAATH